MRGSSMMSALRLLLGPAIAFIGAFLAPDIAAAAEGDAAKPNRIKIDYAAPKNPAHQMIYRKLREIRALENLREFLSLSFTNPLFLRFEGPTRYMRFISAMTARVRFQ